MGINYNPRTVTDGLVLALDAGNAKSYPGIGTDWFDLSGNGNTGNIAQVSIYNRALTASEISQNFNALRGRFGI